MDRTAWLLRELYEDPSVTQRRLSEKMGLSLGSVNRILKEAEARGLIRESTHVVSAAGKAYLEPFKMDGAVILAAGFGSRFVPLTYDTPKGLLEVFGERMVERQIRQLREAGIYNITLVVGYLKEKFEYLIDRFGVKLLYNPDFAEKNNLSSLIRAKKLLEGKNVYVIPSDNWYRENPFHLYEPGAWYASVYIKGESREWALRFNKNGLITDVAIGSKDAWVMMGPACFTKAFSASFLPEAQKAFDSPGHDGDYWENVYLASLKNTGSRAGRRAGKGAEDGTAPAVPEMYINRFPDNVIYEFENLEELRLFDPRYQEHSDNTALELISHVFNVPESGITEIRCLKKGMTNKSFLFRVGMRSYICRIPGRGTEHLVNRREEAESYNAVADLAISDKVLYLDPETGYKISEYYDGARTADPRSESDMERCMEVVRKLHESGRTVNHRFDIRERISFYESLCAENGGVPFEDYMAVRRQMTELMDRLDHLDRPLRLSHIDANVTNFLFIPSRFKEKLEAVRLIDWEYAGMADPLIDISMCAIYSYYTREQTEVLMNLYLKRVPTREERLVVYAYMALGGFLWMLWAIYKENLGETFGEYTLIMYRYAKDYYKLAKSI